MLFFKKKAMQILALLVLVKWFKMQIKGISAGPLGPSLISGQNQFPRQQPIHFSLAFLILSKSSCLMKYVDLKNGLKMEKECLIMNNPSADVHFSGNICFPASIFSITISAMISSLMTNGQHSEICSVSQDLISISAEP